MHEASNTLASERLAMLATENDHLPRFKALQILILENGFREMSEQDEQIEEGLTDTKFICKRHKIKWA